MKKYCILFLFVIAFSFQAAACSCLPPTPINEADFFYTDLVFIGKIIDIKTNESGFALTATFEVYNPLKTPGSKAQYEVVTASNGAACGLGFEEGDFWYLWAYAEGDGYSSNLCTRSFRIDENNTGSQSFYDELAAIDSYIENDGKQTVKDGDGTATGRVKGGLKVGCWKYYNAEGILQRKCKYVDGVQQKCKDVK